MTIMIITIRFVKPIQMIRDEMSDVAKGDYTGVIPVLSQNELGELTISANTMTKQLQKIRSR